MELHTRDAALIAMFEGAAAGDKFAGRYEAFGKDDPYLQIMGMSVVHHFVSGDSPVLNPTEYAGEDDGTDEYKDLSDVYVLLTGSADDRAAAEATLRKSSTSFSTLVTESLDRGLIKV